jgi:hypothetical protein
MKNIKRKDGNRMPKYQPKHLPEIERDFKDSYYPDLYLEDRVKCLILDLKIQEKNYYELLKDIADLHKVFQDNSYVGMWGKDIIKESAKILTQIFKVLPPYGDDFPYQCKCPHCKEMFLLPNYKLLK